MDKNKMKMLSKCVAVGTACGLALMVISKQGYKDGFVRGVVVMDEVTKQVLKDNA